MNDRLDALLGQIRHLEKELILETHKKETEFCCEIHGKKVQFTEAAKVLQTRITLCQKLRAERSA
jgi:hypothetical protein